MTPRPFSRRLGWPTAPLLVLALVAAACGRASGRIEISGSSTVEPISARVAEKFSALNPGVAIKVEGQGTGDGAQLFCSGRTDIGDASRPYKDAEKDLCARNGIEFIELVVAIDGLTVLTNRDNDAVACLATADLYALMGPESLGFDGWADANLLAAEIGAPNSPYPDAGLVITAPGEESGTYDSFVEFAIKKIAEERGQDSVLRPDYVASPNDNVIVEGIAGSPASLGFVGYAFYTASRDRVKALAVDDGEGCVVPTAATIADGSYPYTRNLYIYVNQAAALRPEVAAYVDLYLSEVGLASVDEAGYTRLGDYGPTLEAWAKRQPVP
ncbi:MAG: substrate-binding domain-containing protein [Actinomycetota bacterium]